MAAARRLWRWSWLSLLGLFAALVIILGGVIFSESGRLIAAKSMLAALRETGLQLEVEGLRSPQAGDWQADKLTLYRGDAPWVSIESLELQFSLSALTKRQLLIRTLVAKKLEWHNLPPQDVPTNMPTISSLWSLKLEQLQVQQWRWLGFDVAPPDYQLDASAMWRWGQTPLAIDVDWREIGSSIPLLSIHTRADAEHHWQIAGQLSEVAGGFMGAQLHLPPTQILDAEFDLAIAAEPSGFRVQLNRLLLPWAGRLVTAKGVVQLAPDFSPLASNSVIVDIDGVIQQLSGHFTAQQLQLDMQLDRFPVELLQPWLPAPVGLASGRLNLTLPLEQPAVAGTSLPGLDLRVDGQFSGQWQAMPLRVALNAQLHQSLAQLTQVDIQLADTHIQATGQLDLAFNQTQLDVKLEHFPTSLLAKLPVAFLPKDAALASLLHKTHLLFDSAHARLSGDWRDPEVKLDTRGQGTYGELPVTLVFDGQVNRRLAQVEQLKLNFPNASLDLQGRVDWSNASSRFTSQFVNVTPELLAQLGVNLNLPSQLGGRIDGKAQLEGDLLHPRIGLDISANGSYQTARKPLSYQLVARGSFDWGEGVPNRIEAQVLTLTLEQQSLISLSGRYDPAHMDLALRLEPLPSSLLLALHWPALLGQGRAELKLGGSLERPELSGRLDYKQGIKRPGGGQSHVGWQGQLATQAGRLQLKSQFSEAGQTLGTLDAQMPIPKVWLAIGSAIAAPPLTLDIQAQGDLKMSQLFIDPDLYPLRGRLDVRLHASGDWHAPLLSGHISLHDGQFDQRLTGTQLRHIDVVLRAEQQRLVIEQASATDGARGKIQATGQLNWQAPMATDALNLKLSLEQAHLLERREISAGASGELLLRGNRERLNLEGRLVVSPLNLVLEASGNSGNSRTPQLQVTEFRSAAPQRASVPGFSLPPLYLNLELQTQSPSYLRGRGLESELEGAMSLRGPLDQLRYSGNFTSPRGRFDLFGKRFTLQRGEVSFDQGAVNLYIPASYRKGDLEIKAELTGTTQQPKLSLSSVPELPQDEILARLIFGKQVQAMTPLEAVRLAAAVKSLKGGGFDPVDKARSLLGVDTLSIDSATTAAGQTGLNLGVGKYIGERVYLEVQRSPNPSTPWQGEVQVELTPSINLESTTGENGRGKVQLLWRRDY